MLNGDPHGPFTTGVPVLFSPAGVAQDEANVKGAYGRFAQILLPHGVRQLGGGGAGSRQVGVPRRLDVAEQGAAAGQAGPRVPQPGRAQRPVPVRGRPGQASRAARRERLGRLRGRPPPARQEEFAYTAGSCDWLTWRFGQGTWDAELTDISPETFIFGVQGPQSLFILEKAAGEPLRDIGFNRARVSSVGGIPVRVLRTGISGELGYELHGPADDAGRVWQALAAAGQEFGIQLLGFRSQPVQHIEAGIATNGLDYLPAAAITPGAPRKFKRGTIGGSFVRPAGSPITSASPASSAGGRAPAGHDFLGRDALASDAASGGPGADPGRPDMERRRRGRRARPMLGGGELPEQMDMPRLAGPSFDQVLRGRGEPGVSTGRTVSRPAGMISLWCRPRPRPPRYRGDRHLGPAGDAAAGDPRHRHRAAVQARPPPGGRTALWAGIAPAARQRDCPGRSGRG